MAIRNLRAVNFKREMFLIAFWIIALILFAYSRVLFGATIACPNYSTPICPHHNCSQITSYSAPNLGEIL